MQSFQSDKDNGLVSSVSTISTSLIRFIIEKLKSQ